MELWRRIFGYIVVYNQSKIDSVSIQKTCTSESTHAPRSAKSNNKASAQAGGKV